MEKVLELSIVDPAEMKLNEDVEKSVDMDEFITLASRKLPEAHMRELFSIKVMNEKFSNL